MSEPTGETPKSYAYGQDVPVDAMPDLWDATRHAFAGYDDGQGVYDEHGLYWFHMRFEPRAVGIDFLSDFQPDFAPSSELHVKAANYRRAAEEAHITEVYQTLVTDPALQRSFDAAYERAYVVKADITPSELVAAMRRYLAQSDERYHPPHPLSEIGKYLDFTIDQESDDTHLIDNGTIQLWQPPEESEERDPNSSL